LKSKVEAGWKVQRENSKKELKMKSILNRVFQACGNRRRISAVSILGNCGQSAVVSDPSKANFPRTENLYIKRQWTKSLVIFYVILGNQESAELAEKVDMPALSEICLP
jgi:hypothetical protein